MPPFFNLERCISNDLKKHYHPEFTELSSKTCSTCRSGIKLKHTIVASKNGYQPPTLCYECRCKAKKRLTSRQRKAARAKEKRAKRMRIILGTEPP